MCQVENTFRNKRECNHFQVKMLYSKEGIAGLELQDSELSQSLEHHPKLISVQ